MTTIITDRETTVDAPLTDGRLLVDPETFTALLGWQLKPEGLCKDDVCVPVRDRDSLTADGRIDVLGAAAALRRPVEADGGVGNGVVAIALPSEDRRRALDDRQAPACELPDLEGTMHSLDEWHGRKRLLVAFASW